MQERTDELLCKLWNESFQNMQKIFNFPVTDDVAPGYSDVIKTPMDLDTIHKRYWQQVQPAYNKNSVAVILEIDRDVRLLLSNCFKYN